MVKANCIHCLQTKKQHYGTKSDYDKLIEDLKEQASYLNDDDAPTPLQMELYR